MALIFWCHQDWKRRVGSSRRSPQTHHGAQRDGDGGVGVGVGEGGGEGGGGWAGWCWRTPPLGDSVSCRWVPGGGGQGRSEMTPYADDAE